MSGKITRRTNPTTPDPQSGFTEQIREFCVVRFALGLTPTQVARHVNDEFGLTADRRQVNRYNPGSAAMARKISTKWLKLYQEIKERRMESLTAIPMANRDVRVRHLNDFAEAAIGAGKHDEAAKYLEQIAKEVGNVHSNERVIKGRLAIEQTEEPASIEELRNLLADRIAEAFEKNPVKPNAPGSQTPQ